MHDLRDALRAVLGSPVVCAVAIASLALGIGANTTIFTILNSLLVKPLPVHSPEQLAILNTADARRDLVVSYDVWRAIRDQRVFERAFAWATDRVAISSTADTTPGEAVWATGDFFDVLGVQAVLGRTFTRRDDVRGGGPEGLVAVISHELWQRQYGGSADAIGRTIHVERAPFTIIGVTPPGFFGLNVGTAFDVVLPLETEPQLGRVPPRLDNRHWTWLRVMARLAPGEDVESLTASVRRAQPLIREATMPPYDRAEDRESYLREAWTVAAAPAGVSRFRRQYGPALVTLLAMVAVMLLIACANVATVMLARAAARRQEFSIRLALGASRGRLVKQVLIESLIISTAGAACGLALADWSSRLLVRQLSTWAYSAVLDLSLDWRVLGVTAAVTVATAIIFGAAPAVRAGRSEPNDALQQPRATARSRGLDLSEALIVLQIALSLLLVVGAGLFVRSFAALAYRDLGFDRSRLLVAVVDTQRSAVPVEDRAALFERLREAAVSVSDVESAALSMATPLGSAGVRLAPAVLLPTDDGKTAPVPILANPVSPGWFRTYGTRLLAGRDFGTGDRAGAPHVAIVNDAFAQRYFRGVNPVGRVIEEEKEGTDRRAWQIIGLVENAAFTSVREPVEPTIYTPLAQVADEDPLRNFPSVSVTVRAGHGSPMHLSSALASAIGRTSAGLSVSLLTLGQQLDVYYIRERLLALLSGFFGVFALLLAAVGLYGVTSDAMHRRRGEIGIRMALGAEAHAVLRMLLGRVTILAALGVAIGLIVTWWVADVIGALLYEIGPRDPWTITVSATVLALVAVLAGWLPARRAARLDPATVLRDV